MKSFFFADEGGYWMLGIVWIEIFPAWFACLSATIQHLDIDARLATADDLSRRPRFLVDDQLGLIPEPTG
jgi:hypothetical protein